MSENTSEGLVPVTQADLADALLRLVKTAEHARVFIGSRQRMHPDGQALFDEDLTFAMQTLARHRQSSARASASVGREEIARAIYERFPIKDYSGSWSWDKVSGRHGHYDRAWNCYQAADAILALIRPAADVERATIERCAKVARSFADRAEKGDLINTPARNVAHMIAAALQVPPPAEAENGGGR